jgi:hypothetical protein
MHVDLSDEETAALAQELHEVVENDRAAASRRSPKAALRAVALCHGSRV